MRIPKASCSWTNRATNELASCTFQMFLGKMEDIQDEFGGSPRKQTKADTIIEGFKAVHNASAAANLIGQKFVISRSGKPLHLTTLPTDVLKNLPLPQEYEDDLKGNTGQARRPVSSGAFAGFGRPPIHAPSSSFGADVESKRIALAAKRLFMELGAALDIVYAHNDDLFIVEVAKTPKPESMVEALFNNGDNVDGHDNWNISFGLLKDIQ